VGNKAIEAYKHALRLREETNNLPRIALTLTMLSYALTHRGTKDDLHQAIENYKRSSRIDILLENWQAVARYWGDVAVTYNKRGEYQTAIDYSEQALDRNERIGFRRGIALTHVRLTESYLRLNRFDKASFHAEQACKNLTHLATFDRKMIRSGFCNVLIDLAKYLQNARRVPEAIMYVKVALELATEANESVALQTTIDFLQQLQEEADRIGEI